MWTRCVFVETSETFTEGFMRFCGFISLLIWQPSLHSQLDDGVIFCRRNVCIKSEHNRSMSSYDNHQISMYIISDRAKLLKFNRQVRMPHYPALIVSTNKFCWVCKKFHSTRILVKSQLLSVQFIDYLKYALGAISSKTSSNTNAKSAFHLAVKKLTQWSTDFSDSWFWEWK